MLNELLNRYPQLSECADGLREAVAVLIACYEKGGKLLLCGNGGSCADCDHISGELMKGFLKKRPLSSDQKAQMRKKSPQLEDAVMEQLQNGLPAISLPSMAALNSAFCNDVNPDLIYAQSVMALGRTGDVLIAISTSGNAQNVVAAAKTAKALGLSVIALTGKTGGKLGEIADICIRVPETQTYQVQELHLPVYHCLCAETEAHFFPV